jgi:glycosyltransferase involved in cell wall biosynthesis
MRIIVASRIFAPEPAAASFRLAALAAALADAGHDVTVMTSRLPRGVIDHAPDARLTIRRAPVLRDRTGAVRGYVPYLSFDIPLFFRLLLARRAAAIVVEPPPTTGLAALVAARLRRTPVVYYAADVLADAAASAGSPGAVVRVVRWMERTVWRGSAAVLSVSASVTARLLELEVPAARIVEVGNGIDTGVFAPDGPTADAEPGYALYAGTASEVHGAGVFVEALAAVPEARLVFMGGGVELDALRRRAEEVAPGRVVFRPTAAPEEVARWLRGAAVAVASVKPDGGYQFAFPTKLYAAAAAGAPLLYAGDGPGVAFAQDAPLGHAAPHDPGAVADRLRALLSSPATADERRAQAEWARAHVDLSAVAGRAAAAVAAVARRRS